MSHWCHSRLSWLGFVFLVQLWHVHRCHSNMYTANGRNLTSVPSDLLSNVTHVELKMNRITEVGNNSLSGLANLEKLYMGKNQLASIYPEAFCGTVLRIIGLTYNNFSTVPELRCLNDTLKTLYLSWNKLQVIQTGDFRGLGVLRDLYLDHNLLHRIEGIDWILGASLQILKLESNLLDDLNITWSRFDILRVINLSGNRIQQLRVTDFNVPPVKRLNLSANHMTCLHLVSQITHSSKATLSIW